VWQKGINVNNRKIIPIAALTVLTIFGLLLVFLILQGLRSISEINSPMPTTGVNSRTSSPVSSAKVSPTNVWLGLQERTPYPYTRPLPDSASAPIDGIFTKLDDSWPQWWMCRRCADYRPAGGIWKLRFDRGVMRIHYNVTEWASLASYEVSGDRLYIFNDPYCPEAVGEYRWALEDKWGLAARSLDLEVISDSCSFGLRAENLGAQAWGSCSLPNEMTGASDHWHTPPGCEDPDPAVLSMTVEPDDSLVIEVHGGHARDFVVQPDVYADANRNESALPEGIEIRHDDSSIPYGLNRVLWGEGSWVETSTELPFEAIGVQVLGDNTIGWARLLFDGQEVWRGDTREIWMDKGRYGGYIEIAGFEPGRHTLRVESLGVDYHPVVVAFFGFNLEDGVILGDDGK
jgi:hypothetical protein